MAHLGTTKIAGDLSVSGLVRITSDQVIRDTLELGYRASNNPEGRFFLVEGTADTTGEASGRIMFTEHNSTTASADGYGLSLVYQGNGTMPTLPSGYNANSGGNGTWSLRRHENDVNGAPIMSGSRNNDDVTFHGSINVSGTINNSGNLLMPNGYIKFGPGDAGSDDAHIQWLGGSNAGHLRISTSDDGGTEYIEFGDYDLTGASGVFTQWMRMDRNNTEIQNFTTISDGSEILRLVTSEPTGLNYFTFYDSSARKGYIGYGSGSEEALIINNDESGGDIVFQNEGINKQMVIGANNVVGIGVENPGTTPNGHGQSTSPRLHILHDGSFGSSAQVLRLERYNNGNDIVPTAEGHIGMYINDNNVGGGEVARISWQDDGASTSSAEGTGKIKFWTSSTGGSNAVPEVRATLESTGRFVLSSDSGDSGLGMFALEQTSAFTGSSNRGPHIFGKAGGTNYWWLGSFDSSAYESGFILNATNDMQLRTQSTERIRIDSTDITALHPMNLTSGLSVSGTINTTQPVELRITGPDPTIGFDDTEGQDNFYIHINSNNFYVLADRNDSFGNWESPHPLQLEADTNTAYTFGDRIVTDADKIPENMAGMRGWVPAYDNSDLSTVTWNFDEDAVELYSPTDDTIGMAYQAVRIKSGETKRFTVMLRGNSASTSGLYIRLYHYDGNLPDGKTHVSNSAFYTLVQEDTRAVDNWVENDPVPTSWTTYEYEYTAPVDGYVSLVILNWRDHGTNRIYAKTPDIQTRKVYDAYLLGGIEPSSFLRSDINDTATGNITWEGRSFYSASDTPQIVLTNATYGTDLLLGGWNSGALSSSRIAASSGNLHIDAAAGSSTYINYYDGSSDIILGNGSRVGIGTSSPGRILDVRGSATFDGGTNTYVDIVSNATGKSELSLYGDGQGTGRVYVGQDPNYGGGIEFNGDSSPVSTGAGDDYFTLWRRDNGTDEWTARNKYNSNDWEFRGNATATGFKTGNFEMVHNTSKDSLDFNYIG